MSYHGTLVRMAKIKKTYCTKCTYCTKIKKTY